MIEQPLGKADGIVMTTRQRRPVAVQAERGSQARSDRTSLALGFGRGRRGTVRAVERFASIFSAAVLTVGGWGLAGMGGCASGPDANHAGPGYPATDQGDTLDIQVVRDSTVIRLTNTTARSFGPSRLWVNRWFSRGIDRFEVGQTLELSLWDFRDQYGESFRAGGFFSTRKPEQLVLAQLQSGDELFGLVVVNRGEP